ncbi:MAG TPA: hypothetical protein VMW41_00355 [Candidatus Bathyarchaeia archaeon]|uniref:Uncharacterized protein n=1 Tax=viral metagenome TaxID=1070528 RepID=A0A6M3M094_9ZZZZ|nr:hypothetical protein [Candidatus Bathyarchaeia archaeon]
MRTKDDILYAGAQGIKITYDSPPFERKIELLKLEIALDIRDIFSQALICLDRIGDSLENLK